MLILLYFLFMNFAMPTLTFYAREAFISILSFIIFIGGMCMLLRAIGICVGKGLGATIMNIFSKAVGYLLRQISNIIKWFIRNITRFLTWVFRNSKRYFSSRGLKTWQCNLFAILITAMALLIII